MKTIVYRGGVLVFELPFDWIEEYGDEGGGTFYADLENSGTLRLNILTYDCGAPQTQETSLTTLQSEDDEPDVTIESLPDGRSAIKSYSRRSEENGEAITLWFWEIASAALPQHLRIAIFSYCALTSQENTPTITQDLAMLNTSLRKCEFAPEAGS